MSKFEIERAELPPAQRGASSLYDDIVTEVSKKPIGNYEIKTDKKPNTLYSQLSKTLKKRKIKNVVLHKRKDKIYLEKV